MSECWDEEEATSTPAASFSFNPAPSKDDGGWNDQEGSSGFDREPTSKFESRTFTAKSSVSGGGRRNYDGGFENGGEDSDDRRGGFGGNRRGGFGGGGGRGGGGFRNRDGDGDGEGGGRRFGGFRNRDNDDSEGGGRRFGGGGGGFRNRDNDENGEGGGRRFGGGGFRGRDRDGDGDGDGEGGGRRFGGGGRNRDGDGEGGGGGEDGGPKRELYIPPPPPDDEGSIFATINAGINFDRYDEIPVEVTGSNPPKHINSFEQCEFFDTTKRNIERCKYTRPTPVQKYAIPIILAGRDLMACAQTGSGKTAAFLLPSITRLIRDNVQGASRDDDAQHIDVLIVSPTRELTLQIYNEARKFTHETIYRPVVVYGGTSVGHQLRQVENGCNILVGTPGRLIDFLNRRKVALDSLKVLILDEADRMLDMGFEPEIRKIVEQFEMPKKGQRQTLMFSATFPEQIQRLAADFLSDYLFLTVGRVGGATTDIVQKVLEVGEYEKRDKLSEILTNAGTDRTLVFVETKRNADFLATFLSQVGFPTTSIHGDRFQREREEALRDFRSGRAPVLVATSVAARGLDIPEVKHVVNYDLPGNIEEYVHRIGRTGRIGNKGLATAFFQADKDSALARSLVKILSDAEQDVPEFLEIHAEQAIGSNYGPAGGQFASKDIRSGGRGGRGGGGGGGGDGGGDGGFGGGFGDSSGFSGGFTSTAAAEEESWD